MRAGRVSQAAEISCDKMHYYLIIFVFLLPLRFCSVVVGPPQTSSGPFSIFNHPVDLFRPFRSDPWMTEALDTVFSALADPTRRAILAMLLEDDMAVTDLADPFAISLAAISKHLQVLADAGLISQEKRGRVKWCKLEPDALREASVWMQGFGQMGGLDLDAFERFLERELSDEAPLTED
jgi:DNA-binding transcriptional ArsR family regulator